MHKEKKPITNILTGIHIKKDACIVVVKTEWNSDITDSLEASCITTLNQHGITTINSYTVPGAVELPFAIKHIATNATTPIDAIIAFGCVIKGGTPHFDYVCQSVTQGITTLNLQLNTPVIFGVLTVDYKDQAIARINNGREGDKGTEAALTAIKMIAFATTNKY